MLVELCPILLVCTYVGKHKKAFSTLPGLLGMLTPACLFILWYVMVTNKVDDVPGAFALWLMAFALLALSGAACAMGWGLLSSAKPDNDAGRKQEAQAAKQNGASFEKTARADRLATFDLAVTFVAAPVLFLLFVGCLAAWRMLMSPLFDGHAVSPVVIFGLPGCLLGGAALGWCAVGAHAFNSVNDEALEELVEEARDIDRGVEEGLKAGSLKLLSGAWLRDSKAERLPRCQDLPPGALMSDAAAARAYREGRVLVLSYGWLQAGEPDPSGIYLRALRRFLRYIGEDAGRCGVFWDFASLPQKDPALFDRSETPEAKPEGPQRAAFEAELTKGTRHYGGEAYATSRSPQEYETFKKGLKLMGNLYGSMWRTTVVQHKLVPTHEPSWNAKAYEDRGWCCFEEGVARLAAGHRSKVQRRLAMPTGWGPWAGKQQPKVVEISDFYPHVVEVPKPPTIMELEASIDKATFTGAADRGTVVHMLKEFNTYLDLKLMNDAKLIARERNQQRRTRSVGLKWFIYRLAPKRSPSVRQEFAALDDPV